jgi:hypothetical protein
MIPFLTNLIYLVAMAVSVALGVKRQSVLTSVAIGAVAFQIAYMIDHFALMYNYFRGTPDWGKRTKVLIFQLIIHAVYSIVLYGIGRGIAHVFLK